MKNIFRNLKKYWYFVLLIFVLLFVQAYCDLSLPDYTSDLIDVGISNSGIEHPVPEYLTETGYNEVQLFLTDSEKEDWEAAYSFDEGSGYYKLVSTEADDWEKLDEEFSQVIAIVYMMTSQQGAELEDFDLSSVDFSNMDMSAMNLEDMDLSNMDIPTGNTAEADLSLEIDPAAALDQTDKADSAEVSDSTETTDTEDIDSAESVDPAALAAAAAAELGENADPAALAAAAGLGEDFDPTSMMSEEQLEKMEKLQQIKETMEELGVDITSDTLMLDIRGVFEDKISSLGDSIISSMSKQFASEQYELCGVDMEQMQTDYLWSTGAKMLCMALVMALAAILVGFLASRVAAGVGRDLRNKVFRKVMSFSNAELDKFSTASLITRSTNDVQQIQMVTVMLLRMVLYAPILAVGGIINISKYNSGMNWIIILAVGAVLCLIAVLMVVAMPKFKVMQTLVDKVNLVAREILTGIPVIRAFGREKKEEERFDEANKGLTKIMLFTNRVMSCMMPAMMLIMNGVSVLIVWVASQKIDDGVLEVGAMTAFITYSMLIIMSFLMLTMISIMLPRAGVAADRIQEVLDTELTIKDKSSAIDIAPSKAAIRFDHVNFKYPDGGENVLTDIDFVAEPGKTTAIIGSTGCGKSTLVKLIPRFFDVTEGSVSIGGIDVKDMSIETLRAQIGYVPQKAILFSGDINSNIAYGAPNATESDIIEAAEIAQAAEFINEKADGYNSAISQGGTNVSGGQKQRLSIARAIARHPKVYIFDDSFSALDFKTDTALRKALSEKTKDAAVIIVAQRVSTILNADQIIVLEEGRMIGKGTHKELVANCEEYKMIAQSQLSEAEFAASIAGKGES